jgi:pilus assembly protein CpaF
VIHSDHAQTIDLIEQLILRDSVGKQQPLQLTTSHLVKQHFPLMTPAEQDRLGSLLLERLTGAGPLADMLDDASITDVMVQRNEVWVDRGQGTERVDSVLVSDEMVLRFVERTIAPLGLVLNRSQPLLDARLPNGSRLHVVLPPLCPDGVVLTIRQFRPTTIPLADFCSSQQLAALTESIRGRKNILVSGATGSGKTTLLNALCTYCPASDRIVTIEDACELRLPTPHTVRLECRAGRGEGQTPVTLRDLVRAALRMRPDRLIIGEVRGPEALDMISALNTGHDGSMTTLHANNARDAVRRLELMVLSAGVDLPVAAIREQIAAAFDLIVHVRRIGSSRVVESICELQPDAATGIMLQAVGASHE